MRGGTPQTGGPDLSSREFHESEGMVIPPSGRLEPTGSWRSVGETWREEGREGVEKVSERRTGKDGGREARGNLTPEAS